MILKHPLHRQNDMYFINVNSIVKWCFACRLWIIFQSVDYIHDSVLVFLKADAFTQKH